MVNLDTIDVSLNSINLIGLLGMEIPDATLNLVKDLVEEFKKINDSTKEKIKKMINKYNKIPDNLKKELLEALKKPKKPEPKPKKPEPEPKKTEPEKSLQQLADECLLNYKGKVVCVKRNGKIFIGILSQRKNSYKDCGMEDNVDIITLTDNFKLNKCNDFPENKIVNKEELVNGKQFICMHELSNKSWSKIEQLLNAQKNTNYGSYGSAGFGSGPM